MHQIERPRLEGSVAVRGGRRLSFAEFGPAQGIPVVWMHGTPGSRRQIPIDARRMADEEGIRIIGVDRPGIGTSTAHLYDNVLDWSADLAILADTLGLEKLHVIGLSGGGPYALAAGVGLPERVKSVGVIGGVAPIVGPDAIGGGLAQLAPYAAPLVSAVRGPLSQVLSRTVRVIAPLGNAAISAYAAVQPRGDKELLRQPEFKAMFVDDLLSGSRFQLGAPLADMILFSRHWGFTAADVAVPVVWWHGDADHIVPYTHGLHMAKRLPHVRFSTITGQAHLGGLSVARDILQELLS